MTLTELKFIIAVAQERNFRRAADLCFVTQPALSLGIKKLEQELGISIFERNRTDVQLTVVGKKIVEQAMKVLDEAANIKLIAQQGNDQLKGPIRIGIIHSVAPYLLPDIIPVLRESAPEMPLDVEENITENLANQLKTGIIDVAILALPFDAPNIRSHVLYDEKFDVIVPSHHPWAKRKRIKPEELASEKVLLLNSGHCFSNQVTLACPELMRKGLVLQGNSLETIRHMVASNLGISVLPHSATQARYSNPLITSIPFAPPAPSRRIAIVWRNSFTRQQGINKVIEAVKSVSRSAVQ